VPLPSVPVVRVGTNELFTALLDSTAPSYTVQQTFSGQGCRAQPTVSFGCGARASPTLLDRATPEERQVAPSPVVIRDSVGAFEYAVLKADDRTEMFKWLADNRFFVPTGTEDAVGPYIHPGSFFLALKLKASATTGDITPIVLEYPADLPMIPLILTSVGATPNMGIQVWLAGNGRAIPRNFHHVVPNEAQLDRFATDGYANLIRDAVASAPKKHAFVTEYAGPASVMSDRLVPPLRFGTEQTLASKTTPLAFLQELRATSFNDGVTNQLPFVVRDELLKVFTYPPGFAAAGITEAQFQSNLELYLGTWRDQHPEQYGMNYASAFDPVALAHVIFEKHVTPMRDTQALFTRFPKLTRLVTVLSPQDMTADPVFSFNASLPDVKKDHISTSEQSCVATVMKTDQGTSWETNGTSTSPTVATPPALRIETMSEEGAPTVVTDNTAAVNALAPAAVADPAPAPKTGCTVVVDPMLLALGVWLRTRRRPARLSR
jgi:hypothetical protein